MANVVILDEEQNNLKKTEIPRHFKPNTKGLLDTINNFFLKMQNIKIKEKIVFYRLLSTMLNAGMWLVKWVSILEKQEKNMVFKVMLQEFISELKEWRKLSSCLEIYPKSFWDAEVWIIRSWEKTWKLNEALTDLAWQIEKVDSISWKLKSAMMYPAMILVVVWGVIAVMMTMVVPKLLEIFENKAALPQTTQILIFISDLFVNYWYLLLWGLFLWLTWLSTWRQTRNWKYIFDKYILNVPVIWILSKKVILSKFSRVFASLIFSWVSIVESLNIVSDVVWNEAYRQRILLLKEDVKSWMKIWESLDGDDLFPDMMIQMIQVWEQAAKLDKTIVKVADFYDEQVDNTISTINKLLEPFIIVFLAVVVWFIAMAIMQPIMNLADTISTK